MVPAAPLLVLGDQIVVLRMDAQTPSGRERVADRGHELVVIVHEDVPGGGSHEQLEPHHEGGEHPRIDPCCDRREQSVIGHGLAPDRGLLLPERADIRHRRDRVGHVEDARHPRVHGSERPRAEVLLVDHARVPQMDVRVYESRQEYPAGPQVYPPVPSGHEAADRDDLPLVYPDLGVPQLAVNERPTRYDRLDVHRYPPPIYGRGETPPSISLLRRSSP